MITSGPVVITTGFIGFLVAGFWGAAVAALGTFLPCYLFTILPAPYFKKYGKRPGIIAIRRRRHRRRHRRDQRRRHRARPTIDLRSPDRAAGDHRVAVVMAIQKAARTGSD